jgi:hypothetical protein
MKIKSILVAFFAVIFLTLSCSKDDSSTTPAGPTGTISGKLMVKNGSKPVGGALIFVLDDNNKLYYTRTQANGDFSFKAPIGQRTLLMQTGGGANFRTSLQVTVTKDQTTTIDPSLCRLNQVANMAYLAGSYDEIEVIVTGLGYTITPITYTELQDYNALTQYDIIFLNCGGKKTQTDAVNATVDTNLASFVTNGGSLYASDWAVAFLTGGATNSHDCGQAGGFIPDDKMCTKTTGSSGLIAGATISDSSLAAALGFATLDIDYDLGAWEQINTYDATFWDVLVTNPATSQPLMVKTTNFSGGTVDTPVGNDSDDSWVTICHTDVDTGAQITITVEAADVQEHLDHGDSLGACDNSNNSGTIYYTTFHNHASGNIGNAGLILEYVILNL